MILRKKLNNYTHGIKIIDNLKTGYGIIKIKVSDLEQRSRASNL